MSKCHVAAVAQKGENLTHSGPSIIQMQKPAGNVRSDGNRRLDWTTGKHSTNEPFKTVSRHIPEKLHDVVFPASTLRFPSEQSTNARSITSIPGSNIYFNRKSVTGHRKSGYTSTHRRIKTTSSHRQLGLQCHSSVIPVSFRCRFKLSESGDGDGDGDDGDDGN